MPRGVKGPPVEFAQIGKLSITKEDRWNWVVSGDERTTYHADLSSAVLAASRRGTDAKAKNLSVWLAEYKRISAEIVRQIQQAVKNQ